jgi:hypothetical protein
MVEVGQSYDPDIIVFEGGALNENVDYKTLEIFRRRSEGVFGFFSNSLAAGLGRSFVSAWAGSPLPPQPLIPDAPFADAPPLGDPFRYQETKRASIASVLERSEARRQPVVLLARPQMIPRRPWEQDTVEIMRTFQRRALFVDPDPGFGPYDMRRALFLPDKVHFSFRGHNLIARALADSMIRELDLLKDCRRHPTAN